MAFLETMETRDVFAVQCLMLITATNSTSEPKFLHLSCGREVSEFLVVGRTGSQKMVSLTLLTGLTGSGALSVSETRSRKGWAFQHSVVARCARGRLASSGSRCGAILCNPINDVFAGAVHLSERDTIAVSNGDNFRDGELDGVA